MKNILANLEDYFQQHKIPIALAIGIVVFVGIIGLIGLQPFGSDDLEDLEDKKSKIRILKGGKAADLDKKQQEKENSTSAQGKILIHVAGAVENPGVFEMTAEDRVIDGIKKAKPLKEADINQLNLAAHLSDGEKIMVPKAGETGGATQEKGADASGKVNLNQANKEELKTLSGVGDKRAEDIIEYRQKNGGFKSKEELQEVSGIGAKTYESLADDITV